jgi:Uma2 family endonuclease
MIANPISSLIPDLTVEEYLDWELRQDIRYEYIEGELVAMTGGTVPHNDVAINLLIALRPHIRNNKCRINVSDVKVRVSPTAYFYPDLVVSCDERDRNAVKLIEHPRLIVEVLSPSTEANDRGRKFNHYRSLEALQEYVLISSEQVSVECFRRGEGKLWLYTPYSTGDTITLESIEWSCVIEQIYEDVQLIENIGLSD